MDERKRDSMIAYLRHRMDDFGISRMTSLPFWRPGLRNRIRVATVARVVRPGAVKVRCLNGFDRLLARDNPSDTLSFRAERPPNRPRRPLWTGKTTPSPEAPSRGQATDNPQAIQRLHSFCSSRFLLENWILRWAAWKSGPCPTGWSKRRAHQGTVDLFPLSPSLSARCAASLEVS